MDYALIASAVMMNFVLCGGVSFAIFRGYKEVDGRILTSQTMVNRQIELLTKKIQELEKVRGTS
jgi:hypothetical protein